MSRDNYQHYTEREDGLIQPWEGYCYVNSPYGAETEIWLKRLADHGNGVALTFARTETKMFQQQVWDRATALRFIHNRLYFYQPDGQRAKGNSGGPSVLIAYGEYATSRLLQSRIAGTFLRIPR